MPHILAIDDDSEVCALIQMALERDGHQVLTLQSSLKLTPQHCRWADCILMDIMMPEEDGFAACQRIRTQVDCPILFLTARTQEADILAGLGLGADDYLTKPFRLAELRARINAHLRREQRTPHSRMVCGALVFDLGAHMLTCAEQPIKLTKSEYAICAHLALHAGQTMAKEQIYEAVFGFDGTADASAITEHIKNIRAKLRQAGQDPIQTVWGVGYQWKRLE